MLLLAVAIVVVAVWAVYWPVCGFGFVEWDDHRTLWKNPDFNPVTVQSVFRYWRQPHMDLWVPATYTFWGAIAAVTGGSAHGWAYHTANVALLTAAAVMALLILRELTGSIAAAALGAALFALHPVQVEPVGWSSGGKDLLSAALSMAAVWQYVRRAKSTGRTLPYVLAMLCFIAAMLSKPATVTLPVVVGLIHLGLLNANWRKLALGIVPWLVLAIPVIIIGKLVQPADVAGTVSLLARPLIAADALAFYFYKLVAPLHLTVDYGRSPEWLMTSSQRYWTWTIPLALAAVAWSRRRKSPWLWVSLGVFAAAVLPVLGLVRFDFQRYSTVGDHYLCFAMLGPALAAASLAAWWNHKPVLVVIAIIVLALGIRSFAQIWVWRNTDTLFRHALSVNPGSLAANGVFGVRAGAEGRFADARAYFDRALRTRPQDPVTRYNFANMLLRSGDLPGAIDNYAIAIRGKPRHPEMRNNYGIALVSAGRVPDGIEQFSEAVRMEPTYAEAQMNLGLAYERHGDHARAVGHLQAALAIDGNLPAARRALDRLTQPPP